MKNGPLPKGHALLRAFLKKNKLSQADASRALGVSGVVIHLWCHDRQRPRSEFRKAIAIWTSDHVPEKSWEDESEREVIADVKPFSKAG